jgi:hypothetical protein
MLGYGAPMLEQNMRLLARYADAPGPHPGAE